MPAEDHIPAAGPPSPDAPEVQAAVKRVSLGMQRLVMRLAEREHCAAAGQEPPEKPPPEIKVGAAPRPEGAAPCSCSITTVTGHDTDSGGFCYA